tara:strand:+ start:118 stop:831 length:714 start_codon:yes stop_codon:yes gene_type:complete
MHDGSISANEGCDLAKNRAKLKAMNEVLGQTISLEEIEKCSGIDGKVSCERNQFFLSSFNGDITGIKFDNPKKTTKSLEDGEMIYFCEVKIEANVTPLRQINDPSFDFSVKINHQNFKDGENLSMKIGFTKPMYLTIFQVLPYEKSGNQVFKLFPNEREVNNYIESDSIRLPNNAKYQVYFPENINKQTIDEYLFFLASEEPIKWLNNYNNIEELKKSFLNSKKRVKTKYKQYRIIK